MFGFTWVYEHDLFKLAEAPPSMVPASLVRAWRAQMAEVDRVSESEIEDPRWFASDGDRRNAFNNGQIVTPHQKLKCFRCLVLGPPSVRHLQVQDLASSKLQRQYVPLLDHVAKIDTFGLLLNTNTTQINSKTAKYGSNTAKNGSNRSDTKLVFL